ncbi:transcriptional regulator, TetR family [Bradyrhizobiaceae bacterium SG-6C]|nr:transcriptional regulator, TetR family [Bradyrhizobiaceae bacterium SG-6C]
MRYIKDGPAAQTALPIGSGDETSTARERILGVAETLFAEYGFNGASMRVIATAAGVALSQLHYYFQTKRELYVAVFLHRGLKITSERKRLLTEARGKYGKRPVPLDILIRNFVYPYLDYARLDGSAYVRLYARLHTEPEEMAREIRSRVFDETTLQYVAAFRECLPQLPEDTLYWRITFMMGTYNYALLRSGRLEVVSGGACDSADMEQAACQILPFLKAAMAAPLPSQNARVPESRRKTTSSQDN